MKKKKVLSLVCCSFMIVSLAACGSSDDSSSDSSSTATSSEEEASSSDGESYSISVILKTLSSEYWGYVEAGAQAYADEHPEYTIDIKGATSETDYDGQQNMIETDLNSGAYDAFVIAPLQADTVATLISGVEAPVIAVDTDIEADEVLTFVGTGNYDASYEGATAAVEAAEEAGWEEIEAICISGVQGDGTATDRLEGYEDGTNDAGGTFLADETQYADAVADKAVTCMEAIIQNHPDGIAIVYANNDDMAIAAAKTAADYEAYDNTIFLGFDGGISACESILEGQETMSVAQEAYDMGYMAVEQAVAALDGEELDDFVDSGCSVITAENAQERMDTLNGYLGTDEEE